MLLNYIFVFFFLASFLVAVYRLIFCADASVFSDIVETLFSSAGTGFQIALGLAGLLTLWQGLLQVGQESGLVKKMSRVTAPFFSVLFPAIPKGHPVMGTILLNFSANLLGLDNAATPVGLQAMQDLQKLNPRKDTASDPMIMFLAINASGLTLLPITIIMYRIQLGSHSPSEIFLPILLATSLSTLGAILLVSRRQGINLFKAAFVVPVLSFLLLIVGLFILFGSVEKEVLTHYSTVFSHVVLFSVVCMFVFSGLRARINVFEVFIEGAKGGFHTAVKIIPYLVSLLVAIGVFRASGGMDMMIGGIRYVVQSLGGESSWLEGLPTMLMKPISGSGARGMMIDAMKTFGPDSFVGKLVCTVQGASDTTFYVIATYYGSVAIRKTRYTLGISLLSDLIGAVAATIFSYLFFF